ncbi:MAG: VTT domain-containing protein [Nitratireductor sp.]|jgi:uncharacterized membrane protein YdjX (TVP38/TMEM64 family)|nr:VTT domain-containing protein [Nitratireductor sp.]
MSNRFISALRQIGPKLLLRGAVMIAVLIAAGYLLEHYKFQEIVDYFRFSGKDDAGWMNGRTAFVILSLLFTAIGGPRQAVAFFAAYFFGLGEGFFIALFATVLGSLAALAAAASFREEARRFIRGKLDIALQMWGSNAFMITLLIRLLPVGSNLVTNLAAGVMGIPLLGFIAGSAAGYIPQTLVFALMGSGVNLGSQMQIGLSIVLFVLSVVIGVRIYARYRREFKGRQRAASEPPYAASEAD